MERLYVEKGRLTAGGVPVLLRGFGLGGWLLPEGYMWRFYTKCDRPRRIEALIEKLCGAEYAASFWERYYGSYITEADIRLAAQNGFNSVRLPFNARHLREPGYLRCIDDCVRWCGKHGVYAILDMHAAPGGQTGQNIDDSERDLPELFMRPEHRDELCALWALLAARYRGEAAVAGFDLLNEPLIRKDAEHNGRLVPLYLRITEAVRRADPERIVIWEGAHWATDFSVFDARVEHGEVGRPVCALPDDDALRVGAPYGLRDPQVKGDKPAVMLRVLPYERLVEQVEARHGRFAAVPGREQRPECAQLVPVFRAHEELWQIPLTVVNILPRLPAGRGMHVEYRVHPVFPAPADAVVYAPEVPRLPQVPGVERQPHRVETVLGR